jgi:crotonobetainyl-CoA:carnitine CoA-transferase CaiB-like acyl-CoA transferase
VTEEQATNLLIALDRSEVLSDPHFATRDVPLENLQVFRDEIAKEQDYSTAEMMERLHAANLPRGPLLDPSEVAHFEQVLASGSLMESTHPAMGAIIEPCPEASAPVCAHENG